MDRAEVSGQQGAKVESEVRIDASPQTVFGFLTDPAKMDRWMGTGAELDPRPGGVYCARIAPEVVARGEFLVVEPPHRVVFTWGWEGEAHPVPPGSSVVEVTLAADGEGTIVRLVHSGLGTDEMVSEHEKGWGHYLGRLAVAAAGGDPGPDAFAQAT